MVLMNHNKSNRAALWNKNINNSTKTKITNWQFKAWISKTSASLKQSSKTTTASIAKARSKSKCRTWLCLWTRRWTTRVTRAIRLRTSIRILRVWTRTFIIQNSSRGVRRGWSAGSKANHHSNQKGTIWRAPTESARPPDTRTSSSRGTSQTIIGGRGA